jgi:hypothetical protein
MAYDNDGTVVGYTAGSPTYVNPFGAGVTNWCDGATLIELNDADFVDPGLGGFSNGNCKPVWFFFPEQREVTAYAVLLAMYGTGTDVSNNHRLEGSNDTTNGEDGTWETATLPGGTSRAYNDTYDSWRSHIKPISFTGAKKAIRLAVQHNGEYGQGRIFGIHLYGEKAAGATPDDLVFIDPATGDEFGAAPDWGDQPLGTTVVRAFRVKNVSPSHAANGINLQLNDADFVFAEASGGPWVVTINIASLAPGASSATLYMRCTTPNPGALLGPRFARIVGMVTSWT